MSEDIKPRNALESSPKSSLTSVYVVLSWIVSLLTPVVLVLAPVRLLFIPAFLSFEYSTPNFPIDTYGFTKEDRLYWSNIARDYLINQEGIHFLGDLRFADGTPVYNQRELKHMIDVKVVLQQALLVGYLSLGVVILLGVWAWRSGWMRLYRRGLSRGGFITAVMIFVIIVLVLASFGIFFVAFHQVFFESGTWIFNYSDTLIRLFPERFWRDIFIYMGLLSLASGVLIGYTARNKASK